MDWLEILRWVAAAVAVVGLVGAGVLATLSWLLNHPKD